MFYRRGDVIRPLPPPRKRLPNAPLVFVLLIPALVFTGVAVTSIEFVAAQESSERSRDSRQEKRPADAKVSKELKLSDSDRAIFDAFCQTHDGWSSDEVILRDELNRAFLDAVRQLKSERKLADADQTDAEINWRLLGLRKAGKLSGVKTTRRARTDVSEVTHLAEMAVRSIQDREKVSSDRVMTDPKYRDAFDAMVKKIQPKADLYAVRKAAFQLRKTRKLKPELITRIADWGRTISSYSVKELKASTDSLPAHPGIYIFRDQTGYLYIGQTENLRKRLTEHLDESHNLSLATYLAADHQPVVEIHAFDPESRAKEVRVRRAYESELIASRKPRFNVQP